MRGVAFQPLQWRYLPLYIIAAPLVFVGWILANILDAGCDLMDRLP